MENKSMKKSNSKTSVDAQNALDKNVSVPSQSKESGAIKKRSNPVTAESGIPENNSSKKKNGKSRVRKKKSKTNFSESSNSFDQDKNTYVKQTCANIAADFSSKMNSADNQRNLKQNRRTSLPFELKDQNQFFSSNSPDMKPSKYRSKTPECKNANSKFTSKKGNSGKKNIKFEPYIPLFQVQQGLKRGEFIEGALRINPRNYEDAYVNVPDGKMDIYIGGMQARNRALNGDLVCVQINPKQEWRILCDAIKDHQEKTGEVIYETISKSKTPSPCKIHTPDKFRSRPVSANSWDSTRGERLPDTLEILGIDRLTQQFNEIAMSQKISSKARSKKKSKLKERLKNGNEEMNLSISFSQSQESSEDCLDKFSPLVHSFQGSQSLVTDVQKSEKEYDTASITENTSIVLSGYKTETYPACDMNDIGTFSIDLQSEIPCDLNNKTFDSEMQSGRPSKSWEMEDSGCNIIISPDDLLNIDGNSLLNKNNYSWSYEKNHDDDSEVEGIAVAPEDLSGDEFTDSASISSSHSQLDQLIEDAEFLASQQDAQNNNIDSDVVIVQNTLNPVTNYEITRFSSTSNTPVLSQEKSLDMECRMQIIQNKPPLSYFEVSSDSVICPVVSESISKCYSSSDENLNLQSVTLEHHSVGNLTVIDSNEHESQNKNVKSRKNSKKSKQEKQVTKTEEEDAKININDLTVEQVMEHPLWPQFIQKTGKVVHVLEKKHSYIAAGHLKLCPDKNPKWAFFSPNDSRIPRMMIPMGDCPQNFYHRPGDYSTVLFLAQIVEWNETSTFASGRLIKSLGYTGDVEAQTEGMLIENSVDYGDFPVEVLHCLPEGIDWTIPANELKYRKDFRRECVFTIDPATARDMDDAVSCEVLDNGNFAVGVHIADVTYFVEQGNELDRFAKLRGTSVYLVQKVVPMLPRKLCDDLCSLNPGKDRLTFSVVWEITPNGEIHQHWVGRSVINSCVKLSYEHAQSMIDNPGKEWYSSEHPEIFGNFCIKDVIKRVNQLNSLAVKLREKRFSNGALRLDQVKLQFTLDAESGLPSGFNVFMQKDSNKLIEEFMLLANMTVAKKIYDTFPDLSLLRRHPPPQEKPMLDIVSMCESVGVILDASSSGALQNSIAYYKGEDELSKAKYELLMHLCSKPMKPAAYFCTGNLSEPAAFHHYALNVPIYTHFTSPIRRYPDILVHRLLGAALRYNEPPLMSPAEMEKCAQHCNDKKYNAKKVSEQSAELFLAVFIRELGCVHAKGMVIGVMDHSFDCLILDMGIIKRVYCDALPLVKKQFKRSHGVSVLNLFWKDSNFENGVEQALVIFATVDVVLTATKDTLQIVVTLKKPEK